MFATDDILFSGPYSRVVEGKTAELLTRLHNFNFDVILVLVFLHVLAVLVYLVKKKQNLIWPMITGRKSKDVVSEGETIKHSRLLIALCVCIIAGLIVWGLVSLAPVSEDSFY